MLGDEDADKVLETMSTEGVRGGCDDAASVDGPLPAHAAGSGVE